jgi:hypothetical protein
MLWKAPSFEESGLSKTRLIDHHRALGAQRRGVRLGVSRHPLRSAIGSGLSAPASIPAGQAFRDGGKVGQEIRERLA